MRNLITASGLDNVVTLDMNNVEGTFEVSYGHHKSVFDTFPEALAEFNDCVVHSATCASLMDTEEDAS